MLKIKNNNKQIKKKSKKVPSCRKLQNTDYVSEIQNVYLGAIVFLVMFLGDLLKVLSIFHRDDL